MFKEFKNFIAKGNVMDLAVGVIIGGAFQAIINSLVNDVLMPLLSIITNKVDLSTMAIEISDSVKITYGSFISAIINFILISFVIFMIVKSFNKLQEKNKATLQGIVGKTKLGKKLTKEEKKEAEEPTMKICPYCLSEIPYKATKCSHCTSDLKIETKETKSKK